jgi:electron transfer flavoprotein beta subunit
MKIAVCVKRVPDTETKVRIGQDGKHIDEAGVQWVINPYDEIALEQALRIKETQGAGEVVVVSLGPPATTEPVIRKAFAMGADRGVYLKDTMTDRDMLSAAKALAEALKAENADIVFFGRQAVDDDSCEVGPMTAQILGIPSVTDVNKFKLEGRKVTVNREIESGEEVIEVTLPACFTCQKGLAEPRLPTLKGIMAAKKKPLAEKSVPAAEPLLVILKMEYPPVRPPGRKIGEGKEAALTLVEALHSEVKII